jgi:peptide deformylase
MSVKNSSTNLLVNNHYEPTQRDMDRFADDARLGLLEPTAQLLREIAPAVQQPAISSSEIQQHIRTLLDTARGQRDSRYANQRKGRGMVGLAAPQVGIPYRIIVVDTQIGADRKKFGKLECFINPEIIWRSRETAEDREGCFSAGLVWGLVRRPVAIKVRAYTPQGVQRTWIFEGFTARIMQHEIDHLDGIRFPERIRSDKKRHWVHIDELETYIKKTKSWPRICSRQRWDEISR